jgi:hypothetical protein
MSPEFYTQMLQVNKINSLLTLNGYKASIPENYVLDTSSKITDEFKQSNFDNKHNVDQIIMFVDRFDYKESVKDLEEIKNKINSGYYGSEEFLQKLVDRLTE